MRVTVLAFASVAQTLGWSRQDLELSPGADVAQLLDRLLAETPALAPHLAQLAVAVDGELGSRTRALSDSAEVALLPPVSGG